MSASSSSSYGAVAPSLEDGRADGPALKKRKRIGTARACDRCRRRKVRCDGKKPCNVCVEHEANCMYDESADRHLSETQYLHQRLAEFERLLRDHDISPKTTMSMRPDFGQMGTFTADIWQSEINLPPPAPPSAPSAASTAFIITPPLAQSVDPNLLATNEPKAPLNPAPRPFSALQTRSDGFERLKRSGEGGRVVLFGETSLYSHLPDDAHRDSTPSPSPTLAPLEGDSRFEWAHNLPPFLHIDKTTHDNALDLFAAYYAPWCMVVDMPNFTRDLVVCNTFSSGVHTPRRTDHYSPLLHCAVLYLGIHYGRQHWPQLSEQYCSGYLQYCMNLMITELPSPTLSTLRGVNLLATSLSHPPTGHGSIGIALFGSAIALIQVIGLNVPCGSYVRQNQMTAEEKRLRDDTFWALYMYDHLRAIALGRSPLIGTPNIDLPEINPAVDSVPWTIPPDPLGDSTSMAVTFNGRKGLRSTVFHWSVKLVRLYAEIRSTLYPPATYDAGRRDRVQDLSSRLDQWRTELPDCIAHPETFPLPHILTLHLVHHLMSIFLFRPFYRTSHTGNRYEAQRCNTAATSILQLLKLFDLFHSIHRAPGSLINVIFSTTTIFLMRGVEERDQGPDLSPGVRKAIEDLFGFMREMSLLHWEAGRGLLAVLSLCSDWLPNVFDAKVLADQVPASVAASPPFTFRQTSMPPSTTNAPDPQSSDASASKWLVDAVPGLGMDDWMNDGDLFSRLFPDIGISTDFNYTLS